MEGQKHLLILAPMPARVRIALLASLADAGLLAPLGDALFDPINWHQSLSPELADTPDLRDRFVNACTRLDSEAVTITFDRVRSTIDNEGRIRWTVLPSGSQTSFGALDVALHAALVAEDFVAAYHRTPHVTISYHAATELAQTIRIRPVTWTIDAVELVSPGGSPYRYRTLGRWALRQPAHPVADQLSLPV